MNRDNETVQQREPSEEINLGDLVRAIWATRVPVVVLLLVFTVGFWLVSAATGYRESLQRTYHVHIQFLFAGVNEGRYPDGTAFASSDLLSPVVLRRVYEMNKLDERGVGFRDFSDSFAIAHDSPQRQFIVQRYRARLDNRNLTSAEIQEIERELTAALERSYRGRAVLTFAVVDGLLTGASALDDDLVAKIMLDVPRVWSKYMVEEAGVFASNVRLYSAHVLDASLADAGDFLIGYEVLKENLSLLRQNIDSLAALPNSNVVRDPDTGYRLADIRAMATHMEDFALEGMLSPALAEGISHNPEYTLRFFRARIQELERRQALMETRAMRVASILTDYAELSPQVAGRRTAPSLPEDGGISSVTTIPQIGSDFLDRLMQLGVDTGDIQFRQELSRDRLDYRLRAADLESSVERLAGLIELVGKSADGSLSASDGAVSLFREVETRIEEIVASMRELFFATQRIAERLNELRYGSGEAIYEITSRPERTGTSDVLTSDNLQRFVLGGFLVFMIGVMVTLLVNVLRRER